MAQRMGPIGFARPSFWLAVEKDDWTAANRLLARHDLQLRLTLDDALGGHDAVAWYRLAQGDQGGHGTCWPRRWQ